MCNKDLYLSIIKKVSFNYVEYVFMCMESLLFDITY